MARELFTQNHARYMVLEETAGQTVLLAIPSSGEK